MTAEQPDPLYDAGSMVFVPYEGGKHYQARIMKKDLRKYTHPDGTTVPMWFYHVHYMGWNKKYDEWVEETGCRTDNPDEEPLQNNKKAKVTKPGDKTPQISLAIPPALKQQLVQDHDAVKKEKRLLPLPRTPSVEQILAAYVKSQQKRAEIDHDAEQVANGLRTYFDRSLGLLLLYAEERTQADTYIADGTLPSTVYGAEHLLRLFVKLPEYLPIAGMTEDQYKLLQNKLHEVLDWLLSKMPEYFVPAQEYVSPMES